MSPRISPENTTQEGPTRVGGSIPSRATSATEGAQAGKPGKTWEVGDPYINPKWLCILQHTLGLDQYGQPPQGRRPCADDDYPGCYRNNYVIGPDSPDFYILRELVEAGMMMDRGAQQCYGGMHVFHATRAGFEAVKQHSPRPPKLSKAKRRWRHFRDVSEVCPGLSFRDYLCAPWRAESEARAGI